MAATLIARSELHPALVDLMMQASARVFSSDTLLPKAGRFPSSDYLDFSQSERARRYITYGTPSLQRYLHIPAQREQCFWPNVNVDSGST
jgi:hypothetical protein